MSLQILCNMGVLFVLGWWFFWVFLRFRQNRYKLLTARLVLHSLHLLTMVFAVAHHRFCSC